VRGQSRNLAKKDGSIGSFLLRRGVLLVGCLALACATLSPEERSAAKAIQIRGVPADLAAPPAPPDE